MMPLALTDCLWLQAAVAAAIAGNAGVGATIKVDVGGTVDPERFTPLPIEATVLATYDGNFTYENGTTGFAGDVAVLRCTTSSGGEIDVSSQAD